MMYFAWFPEVGLVILFRKFYNQELVDKIHFVYYRTLSWHVANIPNKYLAFMFNLIIKKTILFNVCLPFLAMGAFTALVEGCFLSQSQRCSRAISKIL